jgi:hypothetical protein
MSTQATATSASTGGPANGKPPLPVTAKSVPLKLPVHQFFLVKISTKMMHYCLLFVANLESFFWTNN